MATKERETSDKEQAFAEEYAATRSLVDSARAAGYGGNDETLRTTAYRLLKRPHVLAAIEIAGDPGKRQAERERRELRKQIEAQEAAVIAARREEMELAARNSSIASRTERLAFLSAVMRGEVRDVAMTKLGPMFIDAPLAPRLKAADLLAAMMGDKVQRHTLSSPDGEPVKVLQVNITSEEAIRIARTKRMAT